MNVRHQEESADRGLLRRARAPLRGAAPAAIGLLLTGVFALDLAFPLGVAAGVPYVAAVLLALWLESSRARLAVTLTATALTVGGFFVPMPAGGAFWLGLENRIIALFAIWVTAWLGHRLVAHSRAIREQGGRLRAVLESAPDAILTVDRRGRVESCNPAAGAMFGRRCEALLGTPIDALLPGFPGDDRTASRCRPLTALRTDGSEFPAEVSLGLFPRERGRRGGDARGPAYAAIVRDVTILRDAQQRTVRAERLAAIGQTLAVLSHESKNELFALRMGLEMLAEAADRGDDADPDLIAELRTSERRLSRLFEDVRNHAGPIRLNPAPCRLPDVWRRAWSACDRAGRVASLLEDLPPGGEAGLTCVADAFRLEQVFRNLFENALGACADPVRIEVAAEDGGAAGIRIRVRDNGPGLSAEARRRAFDPFFTTKSHGTGLGLPICSRILEAHAGTLAPGEDHGGGAEFVLTLPPRDSSPAAAARIAVGAA